MDKHVYISISSEGKDSPSVDFSGARRMMAEGKGTNMRKLQIDAYLAQLALAADAVSAMDADPENDAKAAASGAALSILDAMRAAGYAPRSFGADTLETGSETPEQLREYMECDL